MGVEKEAEATSEGGELVFKAQKTERVNYRKGAPQVLAEGERWHFIVREEAYTELKRGKEGEE